MECVVLAGGTPGPGHDLWPETRGRPKALVDLGGRPMIAWVLDALRGARHIDRIVVVGLDAGHLPTHAEEITVVPNQGGAVANLYAGFAALSSLGPAAFCWSDIPLVRAEMIDRFVETTEDAELDANVGLVARETLQARFPGTEDLWLRFREGRFIVANFGLMHLRHAARIRRHLEVLAPQRKQAARQALYVGVPAVLRYLLGCMAIADLERHLARRFDLRLKLRVVESPELGLDVDQAADLARCRALLGRRAPA